MQFRLLGPVEVWENDQRIAVTSRKAQALLAVLLLEGERVVPLDTLVWRVWDEAAPAKVAGSVQAHFSRLRRHLEKAGDDSVRLEFVGVGYRLRVPSVCVDALEFNRIITHGQAAAQAGERDRAIDLLHSAETLVRGEPLAGLPGAWAASARAGLQERQHTATLTRIALQLEQDDPRSLIGELRELVGRHPADETIASLLMRALHAAGRTADALKVYRTVRQHLRDEIGIEPHRELRETHERVLRDSPDPPASPSKSRVPTGPQRVDTLEHDPPGFIGRRRDLGVLHHEITSLIGSGQTAICVIHGMAGAGKSTLALHLAHILRGQCPDGALQLHLRGHDPHQTPTSPTAALSILLSMLQVEPGRLARFTSLDQALSLWRTHTRDRRLLLMLDDAADAEQIRSLIPSGPRSIVLVTSRHHLTDLHEAVRHPLALMPTSDAQALFAAVARTAPADDPAAMLVIVKACGRLPLALSVAAGLLRMRASWSTADFAEHLTRTHASGALDTLRERWNATFNTSYVNLPELTRRVFRRLALHPGVHINAPAAAALADATLAQTEAALEVLVEQHLLTEPKRNHYRMHDLLRAFATHALANDEADGERDAAINRLTYATLAITERATALFHPYGHLNLAPSATLKTAPHLVDLADAHQAAAWLDDQQEFLRLVAADAHANGRPREAAALAHLLATFLDRRCLWRESLELHENALHTWTRLTDLTGRAIALGDLATARWRLGELEQARIHCETALSIWVSVGDKAGEAECLLHLGRTYHFAHQLDNAIRCYQQSTALRVALGDIHGQAISQYHLGIMTFESGRYQEGIDHTRTALEHARTVSDETVERNCLNNLGVFHRQQGECERALECFRQALKLAQELGDPYNTAVAEENLGEVHNLTHNPEAALLYVCSALKTFQRVGDPENMIVAMLAKVRAYQLLGRERESAELLNDAAAAAAKLADTVPSARVELAVGKMHHQCGETSEALTAFRRALALAQQGQAILEQAEAHHGIGDALAAHSISSEAVEHWLSALHLYGPLRAEEADLLRRRLAANGTPIA